MIPLKDNIKSGRFPIVNVTIVAACVLMFLYQLSGPGLRVKELAFQPGFALSLTWLSEHGLVALLTAMLASMFMHAGLLHIGSNMLFLWVFGDNIEDRMGHLGYLVFYLVCGVAATAAHTLLAAGGALTGGAQLSVPIVGASGAIAGVLGAYYCLYRTASIRSLIFLGIFVTMADIPASAFLVFWFILQVALLLLGSGGGVAVGAHIGGFVAGYLISKAFYSSQRPKRGPRVIDLRYD
jgi:membrane associated rhomboid family serine protease